MGIIIHDPDEGFDMYAPFRRENTFRFTINRSSPNEMSDIFYIRGLPWCASAGQSFNLPDCINVILSCEFESSGPWTCKGNYEWRTLNVEKAYTTDVIPFELGGYFGKNILAALCVPSIHVNDIVVQLTMSVTSHNCQVPNADIKMSLDDIGRLIAIQVRIASNTEKLLQEQTKYLAAIPKNKQHRKIDDHSDEGDSDEHNDDDDDDNDDGNMKKPPPAPPDSSIFTELRAKIKQQEGELVVQKQANLLLLQRIHDLMAARPTNVVERLNEIDEQSERRKNFEASMKQTLKNYSVEMRSVAIGNDIVLTKNSTPAVMSLDSQKVFELEQKVRNLKECLEEKQRDIDAEKMQNLRLIQRMKYLSSKTPPKTLNETDPFANVEETEDNHL